MVQHVRGRFLRPAVLALAGLLALANTTAAQNLEWTAKGERYYEDLGAAVALCDDVDGDGLADLLIGAVPRTGEAGKAFVYSSATPRLMLLEFVGDAPGDRFGSRVGALGDVDGDGVGDYAVAAPDRVVAGAPLGAIFVWSGTGALLRTITSAAGTQVGLQMVVLGDVDGDGVRDLLYNDTGASITVVLESGATGATIRTHTDPAAAFGILLGRTGDADGDGVEDYVICDRQTLRGKVHVYSGQTGGHLYAYAHAATGVGPAGDADADGYDDLLQTRAGSGIVTVVSAATATRLHRITFRGETTFGEVATAIGDLDGDGAGDFVASRRYDSFDPLDPGTDLQVFSGASGTWIAEYYSGVSSGGIFALDASADVDGDGVGDPLVGSPNLNLFSKVSSISGSGGVVRGASFQSELGSSLAVIGDRDGDGWRDVALLAGGGLDVSTSALGAVQIVSGRDGHELSRFSPASRTGSGEQVLAAVGDVDGDGSEDFAIVCPGPLPGGWINTRAVEVRSGADDALLTTIVPPSGTPARIAAAAETTGAPLLAITTSDYLSTNFYVYDLASGSLVTQMSGAGGGPIAGMGDVDQDGLVDWLVRDAATPTFGVLTGGPTPTALWSSTLRSTTVTSVRDLDGDAIDDVLVGDPDGSSSTPGKVTALSGVDGSKIFEVTDTAPSTWFGGAVASIGDLNRDGFGDFAVGAFATGHYDGAVHVFSGRTATRLYRIDGEHAAYLGHEFSNHRWHEERSVDPDAIPDLVTGSPWFDFSHGRALAFRLDDLFLQISPPSAPPSQPVTLFTRGGPTGNVAGLFAVDFSGTPLNLFLAFGTFDALGEFAVSGTVPAGLSGNTLTLRSYAVGYSGKVVDSQAMTLSFE